MLHHIAKDGAIVGRAFQAWAGVVVDKRRNSDWPGPESDNSPVNTGGIVDPSGRRMQRTALSYSDFFVAGRY